LGPDAQGVNNFITFDTFDSLTVQNSFNVLGVSTFGGITAFNGPTQFLAGVEFTGTPIFSKDTAGNAVISEGQRMIKVEFENEYLQAPIVNVSPVWDIDQSSLDTLDELGVFVAPKQEYIIANVTTKGFTIVLEEPAVTDLKFSWAALAVKDPRIITNVVSPTPTVTPTPSVTPTTESPQSDGSVSGNPLSVTPVPTATPVPTLTPSP
jgi:hypothetical protein